MLTDIRLPVLGEGADSGTIVNVLVKEGDSIKKDDNLIELENEKAVASIPSSASGKVIKLHVKVGQKISVGQMIASIETQDAAASPGLQADSPKVSESKAPNQSQQSTAKPVSGFAKPLPAGIPIAASPSLRKLAAELGIDLTCVVGTESGGRIGMHDLRNYIQQLKGQSQGEAVEKSEKKNPPPLSVDFEKWGPVRRQPMSSLRKIIAERMQASSSTIPHVTQFEEIPIDSAVELQNRFVADYEKQGVRLTFTPLILKALVKTLKNHPTFNSSLDEQTNEMVFKDYIHIGIAVDTEQGLIVPVIKNVDQKSLMELAKELKELATKTRERKISADELKGGTFTISNQGAIGGGFFTPIINKPEVAILGLGRSVFKPAIVHDKIEKRLFLPVALSYDHRVIDGGQAARFVVDLNKAFAQFNEEDFK